MRLDLRSLTRVDANSVNLHLMTLLSQLPAIKFDNSNGRFSWLTGGRKRTITSVGLQADTELSSLTFDPASMKIDVRFTSGERATAEFHDPTTLNPRRGRPVIYLDQCHWSTLANLRYAGSRVKESERIAASRLVALAAADKIILPISSGHMSETAELYGAKRRHVASTMLRHSRGWVMRHPLAIRSNEIVDGIGQSMRNSTFSQPSVFTLEAGAIFASPRSHVGPGLDSESRSVIDALSFTASTFDALMDPRRTARGDMGRWAEANAQFGAALKDYGLSKQHRDLAIFNALILDLKDELGRGYAHWGLSSAEFAEWLTGGRGQSAIDALPFTGLYGQAMAQRQMDPGLRWHNNDLTDIIYLSCSAAYADIVVAEKRAAGYLSRASSRLGREENLFPSLASAIDDIEALAEP